MAGIYLHIPFCKHKCAYCDFYSIVNSKYRKEFVNTLCKEVKLQSNYLKNETVQTIYFGGGTPSQLDEKHIKKILSEIRSNFSVEKNNEITLEANPDDLSKEYLKAIKNTGINRLSIGIQSFNDTDLQFMKRKHSANQAVESIKKAQDQGFENISIDLIYGLPNMTLTQWEENLDKALNLNIQHISSYHLTIEPKTLFYKYHQNKKLNLPTEEESLHQFMKLKSKTAEKGFLHYEISNFALDGYISLHNTNYWMDVKYLGLGPSAHSYNLTSRQWNIQNLTVYMDEISKGKIANEVENLSPNEKFNDFVITSLRTMWGINTEILEKKFGLTFKNYFEGKTRFYLDNNLLKKQNNNFILTEKGMFISDNIMQDFLYD